ncbi:MAG: hypothetical protein Q7S57_03590 [bacterium]|nr:hypothetical protein [bacterium]
MADFDFSQALKGHEAVFRKTFDRGGRHKAFCWTHTLAVGTSKYLPHGYYCGQACFVERAWKTWGNFRLACFWTGEKTAKNVYYGIVPESFVLIPSMHYLRRVVTSLAERLEFKIVRGGADFLEAKQVRIKVEKDRFHLGFGWKRYTKVFQDGLRELEVTAQEAMHTGYHLSIFRSHNILRK